VGPTRSAARIGAANERRPGDAVEGHGRRFLRRSGCNGSSNGTCRCRAGRGRPHRLCWRRSQGVLGLGHDGRVAPGGGSAGPSGARRGGECEQSAGAGKLVRSGAGDGPGHVDDVANVAADGVRGAGGEVHVPVQVDGADSDRGAAAIRSDAGGLPAASPLSAQSSTAYQASALPQRVTTRPALSHQLDRSSVGRTGQISAQI
jgi:hypothetical protein